MVNASRYLDSHANRELTNVRNSRAIPIIKGLINRGTHIAAFDPVAVPNMRKHFSIIEYVETHEAALDGAEAALIMIDWPGICALDEEFDLMESPVVVDSRHAIERREGLVYEGLTW